MAKLTTESLARASSRHPWRTVLIWVGVIVVSMALTSQLLDGVLTTQFDFTNEPEAKQARELVEERLRPDEGLNEIFILRSESGDIMDPEFQAAARSMQETAVALGKDEVLSAVTFYDTKDESLVSTGGDTMLVPITFKKVDEGPSVYESDVDDLIAAAEKSGVAQAWSFGPVTLERDFTTVSEEDLRKGEGFGILVALLVLVAVFGALVAGVIPIAMGIGAITVALGITSLVGQVFEFSFFVTSMISMMGLAVGIDYSLFVVSRYREERGKGLDKLDAISLAGATASRAVFFSGMTVVLALLGMLIIPTTIFRSLAGGSIFVVIAAVAASLTLLPALLSLLGDKINKGRVFRRRRAVEQGAERHGFWDRVTHGVMARPVISLVLAAGLLLAASFSYFDINLGIAGVSTLPDDLPSKQAFEILAKDFSGGLSSPVEIVVDGDVESPEVASDIEALQAALADNPMFGRSTVEPNPSGDLALISAPLRADPSSDAAVNAVRDLREETIPEAVDSDAEVLVGGDTAFNADFFDLTDTLTPIVFLIVLGLSFMLLTIVFRSIVVPIKAILLNLLSVGAAYGLIVLVFQKGVGADLLGFQQVESIEAWLPLFLFSVLFGLSMDYHVFLLSRIREHFDYTHDNTESVAFGLRTTAGLITGAALIMVAVFVGFAAGELVSLQQMGFGLAVAVFLDATIVRSVLVPATMKLLGDRNWYLPKWLRWLPDIHIEGAAAHQAGKAPVGSPEPAPASSNGAGRERVKTP